MSDYKYNPFKTRETILKPYAYRTHGWTPTAEFFQAVAANIYVRRDDIVDSLATKGYEFNEVLSKGTTTYVMKEENSNLRIEFSFTYRRDVWGVNSLASAYTLPTRVVNGNTGIYLTFGFKPCDIITQLVTEKFLMPDILKAEDYNEQDWRWKDGTFTSDVREKAINLLHTKKNEITEFATPIAVEMITEYAHERAKKFGQEIKRAKKNKIRLEIEDESLYALNDFKQALLDGRATGDKEWNNWNWHYWEDLKQATNSKAGRSWLFSHYQQWTVEGKVDYAGRPRTDSKRTYLHIEQRLSGSYWYAIKYNWDNVVRKDFKVLPDTVDMKAFLDFVFNLDPAIENWTVKEKIREFLFPPKQEIADKSPESST